MRKAKAIIVGRGKLKATASLELAQSSTDKAIGLSGRSDVPDGFGMMFDSVGVYWMKGVKVPLDIVFADKTGKIIEIQTMPAPLSGQAFKYYRPRFKGAEITFEFKSGWLRKNGVTPGDRIVVLGENNA